MERLSLITFVLVLVSCGVFVDPERAVKTMSDEGYTEITITGQHGISPHWIGGCGEDDAAAFDVAAKNPKGKSVTATVCCGLVIKGCTIRH